MDKKLLSEAAAFIKEHRSNENNFEALYQKLEGVTNESAENADLQIALQEIKEKQAAEYRKAKETGGTAWPEFEKFASEFEKAVTTALRED